MDTCKGAFSKTEMSIKYFLVCLTCHTVSWQLLVGLSDNLAQKLITWRPYAGCVVQAQPYIWYGICGVYNFFMKMVL